MADNYEQAKKGAYWGMILLAIVTLVEVFVSLFQKGHIWAGAVEYKWLAIGAAIIIAVLSIYKAYFIIYEFMHMGHEVRGLRVSVLLPMALLIWAIIAFFQEGNSWNNSRQLIKDKNQMQNEKSVKVLGDNLVKEEDTFYLS